MATTTQRIDALEQKFNNFEGKFDKLFALLESKQESVTQNPNTVTKPIQKVEHIEYKEPSDGQNIIIQSLFIGSLILSYGDGKCITLENYGEQRPILYRDLISIVNMNKNIADAGYFYINDKQAIHFLGLDTSYKKLMNYNEIENLCFSGVGIEKLANLSDFQKSLVTERLAMKIASNEIVDFNTVSAINNVLKVDVNNTAKRIKKVMAM